MASAFVSFQILAAAYTFIFISSVHQSLAGLSHWAKRVSYGAIYFSQLNFQLWKSMWQQYTYNIRIYAMLSRTTAFIEIVSSVSHQSKLVIHHVHITRRFVWQSDDNLLNAFRTERKILHTLGGIWLCNSLRTLIIQIIIINIKGSHL